jgi:hypothetical protein
MRNGQHCDRRSDQGTIRTSHSPPPSGFFVSGLILAGDLPLQQSYFFTGENIAPTWNGRLAQAAPNASDGAEKTVK